MGSGAEPDRGTLQKSDVVVAKLAFGFAVDFQYAEWRAVALEDDIHGTPIAFIHCDAPVVPPLDTAGRRDRAALWCRCSDTKI